MGTRLSAAVSAAFLTTGVLSSAGYAADAHRVARSERLGVEIDAMGGDKWCQQHLVLNVHAEDAAIYTTPDFTDLIKKLGQVMETECPAARGAEITGFSAEREIAYEGSASSSNGWLVAQIDGTATPAAPAIGTDWSATLTSWLETILSWVLALNPTHQ